MQIADSEFDEASLAALGVEALTLLSTGNFQALAKRFGYAMAHGRDPAMAIQADLASTLASVGATSLVHADGDAPKVGYFKSNETGLLALVEGLARTNYGNAILVELVVTGRGDEKFITLEDISDKA